MNIHLMLACAVFLTAVLMSSCTPFNYWLAADKESAVTGIPEEPWKRKRALTRGSVTEQIAVMAAIFNDQRSGGMELVEQRKQELQASKRGFLPRIFPIGSVNDSADTQVGVGARVSILDFGRSQAAINAAEINLQRAYVDYWERRNRAVAEALSSLLEASLNKAILENTLESKNSLLELLKVAELRLQGGVADQSESEFVRLRIAEVDNEINRVESDLASALSLLSTRLGRVVDANGVPTLIDLRKHIAEVTKSRCEPDRALLAPNVLLAKLDQAIAKQDLERAKAERIPEVIGEVATLRIDTATELTSSISLDSGVSSLLTGHSEARAAQAAVMRAESAWRFSQTQDLSSRNQLLVSQEKTIKQLPSLEKLINYASDATKLFLDQRAAGSRQLTDGVAVYRSLLDAQNQYNQIQALQIRNSITLGALDGSLISIGPTL